MSSNKKTLIDGDFQVGSAHFKVDTENNYVGFNNATPQNKIDVQIGTRTGTHSTGKPLYVTGVTSTNGAEFVSDDGTAGIGIGSSNIFATETNQNITIAPDGTGAVGIKTATPNPSGETFDLWVQGDTKITGNVTVNEIYGDGSGLFNVPGTQWVSSSEDIYFLNNTGSGEGKVGIGKTVPEYKLDILDSNKPTIRVKSTSTGDGDALLILDSSATGESDIDFNHDGVLNWRIRTGDAAPSGTTFQLNNANDSDVLTIQQNGNVGVGTNSPNVPLEVNKSAGGEMFRLATSTGTLYAGADANPPWFGTSSDDHLRLVTNGTEKVRIESGGNVGIGTTSPDEKLDVYGNIKLSNANSYASDRYIFTHWEDGTNDHQIGLEFDYYTGSGGTGTTHSRINFVSNATLNTDINGSGKQTMMSVLSNGNVGIGTTDPKTRLHVGVGNAILRVGAVNYAGSAANTSTYGLERSRNQILFSTWRDARTDKIGAKICGINKQTYSSPNARHLIQSTDLAFYTVPPNATNYDDTIERLRITDAGNVGIGTTDPGAKLHVNGGDFKISAAGGGGLYDNNYQWLECDNDASWYRLARTAKTNGIACYNGIAINQEGGLVVGSWDSPNALGVGNGKFTGTVTASTFSATSRINIGTSASIRQSSSAWTGDPGSGVGKIEYHSNRWYVVAGSNSTELLRVRRNDSDKFFITNEGNIGRTSHSNGYLVGSYNNVGGNDTKTNPIYTIGSSYRPSDTSLGNMYGIGYSHGNFTSILTDGWGMYVASDGDARIGLNAQHGHIKCTGHVYCGNTVYVGGSTTRGLRGVSGNYGTVQTTGEGAGNHEGYSIDGRWVFMSGDSNSCGIYNDTDNKWAVLCYRNAQVRLDYNGSEKLKTEGGGVTVTGELNASAFSTRGTGSFGYNYDGVFMRPDGQVYISVDDNFYFRDNASTSSNLRRHYFNTNSGHIYAEGTVYSNYGLDYAEYFEWFDGNPDNEDRIGCSVSLVENTNRIKKCEPGEIPLGVVSGTSSMTGGGAGIHWSGYWKNDEWGRATYKQMEDDNGELVFNEDGTPKMKRAINPDYDETLASEYLTRDQRKEWACVGLLGQVFVKKGVVTSTNWIKMKEVDTIKDLWFINATFVDNTNIEIQLQAEKAKTYELRQKVELLEMSHASLIQRIEALEKL
jgi:hypothetical protein